MLKEIIKEMLKEEITGKPSGSSEYPTESPYEIGKNYHVRTVTMAVAGELVAVYDNELVFSNASWVADTGRFNKYLKDTSMLNENEPFESNVIIGRGAIVDCTEIQEVFTGVK